MSSQNIAHIPALTGLRGLGAIWVVLLHLHGFGDLRVFQAGFLGVDLFFLLSGCVLTHIYSHSLASITIPAYVRFLCLRLARIYPLYAVVLVVMGATFVLVPAAFLDQRSQALPEMWSGNAFLASLLLVQNWIPAYAGTWNSPGWSVSIEWAAYLVFPVFLPAIVAIKSPKLAFALALASIGALAAVLISVGTYSPDIINRGAFLRMAAEFTAGCLLCRAFHLGFRIDNRVGALAAALLITAMSQIGHATLLALPLFVVLVSVAMQRGALVRLVFENKLAIFLGEISYSIYLTHWLLLILATHFARQFGAPLDSRPDWCALFLAATLAISYCAYRLVEMPNRNLGRRLAARIGQRAATPAKPSSALPTSSR